MRLCDRTDSRDAAVEIVVAAVECALEQSRLAVLLRGVVDKNCRTGYRSLPRLGRGYSESSLLGSAGSNGVTLRQDYSQRFVRTSNMRRRANTGGPSSPARRYGEHDSQETCRTSRSQIVWPHSEMRVYPNTRVSETRACTRIHGTRYFGWLVSRSLLMAS